MILDKKERLNKAVAKLKGERLIKTQKDISLRMDMNVNTISQALKGNEKYLTDSFLKKFCFVFKIIDEEWLIEGVENVDTVNDHVSEGKLINEKEYPSKQVFIIPLKGRGGLENSYFDEVMFQELRTENLTIKEPSSSGSKWFKIEVEGISMDDGSKRSLSEGDWAYCRSISKQHWKNKFHTHKFEIFCFFHNERGIIFKKIIKQNTEKGELTLSSLHSDKKLFPDFDIKISECSYICNVIKVLSEF